MKELNAIHKMWAEDSVLVADLDEATRQSPKLHCKYLRLISEARYKHKQLELEQKRLLKQKWAYYNGKMDKEQIDALGWDYDPFNGLRVLKGDMNMYYDSDLHIQKSIEDVAYWKNIIDTLSEIIENIRWRHQNIGNIIKWRAFEAGT